MKKNMHFFITGLIMLVLGGSLYSATSAEKEQARNQVVLLKKQIEDEKKAYESVLQEDLNQEDRRALRMHYIKVRGKLLKQIEQQQDVINDNMSATQKWLLNTAKIVGGIGLASLALYKFFQTPPGEINTVITPPILSTPSSVPNDGGPDLNKREIGLKEQPAQMQGLTQEQIARYRTIYHQSLPAAVLSSIMGATATLVGIWNPFGMGYLLTTLLTGSGAAYSRYKLGSEGITGEQLTALQFLRSFLTHPVKLEEINIIPEDMPY